MNKNILNKILENKQLFIPLIFTEKQFNILQKYEENKKLNNAEKKALYTSITNKMKALEVIKIETDAEYFINGRNKIIPQRLEEAKKIINEYSKRYDRVFISGSFLFAKEYGDIDIFIVRDRKYDEKWEDKRHIVFVTEKRLTRPVFQSAAMISIANFIIPSKMKELPIKLGEFMSSYHEAIIEIDSDYDRDLARYIVFTYYLRIKKRLLDGSELSAINKSIDQDDVDRMVKETLTKYFSRSYLYVEIHEYIKTLDDFIKSEKNVDNLKRYKSLYEEIIYDTRRSKATSA
ncbi:MAG TPA: hypothetical protein VJH97_06590 [Candidatus Nanoarchaeia archaeon]|nr:hypothetical protein [Candidatus Nanoarchaeia archaeon]